MGFWMVVVACRKIGLAFEFHFIICRSSSNLEDQREGGMKLQFSAGRDIHLANSRLSVTVVNAFHKRMVSIPTPTIPPAIPMIIPK